jgi:hypothetical protein
MPQLDSLNMQITGSKEMLAKPRLVMKIYVLGVVLLQALGSVTYAKPVTLLGERGGTYVFDEALGTYRGCIGSTSPSKRACLSLGADKRVGRSSWQNGSYLYILDSQGVRVIRYNKIIFQERFK